MIIFHAHENNYWKALTQTYKIACPASVLDDEAFFFESKKGKKGLQPSQWVKEGAVERAGSCISA